MQAHPSLHLTPWPWAGGHLFRPSAWTARGEEDEVVLFRSLARAGSLAPAEHPNPWSLHLGLPAACGSPATIFLANGFVMAPSPHHPSGIAACLVAGPGILVGRCPEPPSLFSAEHGIGRKDSGEWIDTADQAVVLLEESRTTDSRFCVIVSGEARSAALERARAWMEKDVDALLAVEAEKRAALERSLRSADAARPAAWQALESLVAGLRLPLGPIAFRWASGGDAQALLDANATLAEASAWTLVDPGIAGDIVRSALACQFPDGSIPAQLAPRSGECSPHPAWPLMAQAAAVAWAARQEPSFLDYALPRLHRYLAWAIDYYDADRNGTPCWHDRGEAIDPSAFEPGAISADLTALLICEIEAFLKLCASSSPPYAVDRHALTAHRERLAARLEGFLWDPAGFTFRDRHPDGRPAADRGSRPALPLLWTGLSPSCRQALLSSAEPEPVPTDDWLVSPAPAAARVLRLEALSRNAPVSRLTSFALSEFETGARLLGAGLSTGDPSPGARGESDAAPKPWPSAPAGAWIMLAAAAASGHAGKPPLPRALEWIEGHRTAVLRSVVGLAAAAVLAIGLAILVRHTMPLPSMQALAALAEQHCAQGNYDQAVEVYRQLLPGTRGSVTVEMLLGNTYLKKGDAVSAEQCYRNVLERSPDLIPAQLNLALALYRQGRKDDAARQYRQFLDAHGSEYPRLAARAQFALELIEEGSGRLAQGAVQPGR